MFFKQKNGFTLIELIITIAILAILTILALPYFHEIMAKQETIKTTNKLISSIPLAKAQASLQHNNVVSCPSQDKLNCQVNHWNSGFIIFLATNKILQVDVNEQIILV